MRDSIIEPQIIKKLHHKNYYFLLTIEKSRVHTLPQVPLHVGHGFVIEYPPHSAQSKENWFEAQQTPQLRQLWPNWIFKSSIVSVSDEGSYELDAISESDDETLMLRMDEQ